MVVGRETVYAMQRIIEADKIKPNQVDLVRKILRLERDEKIHSVKLHRGTLPSFNIWAEVGILKQFTSTNDFTAYLAEKGLPQDRVDTNADRSVYTLYSNDMRVEFKMPNLD